MKITYFFLNFSENLVMRDLHTSDTNILNAWLYYTSSEYFGVESHARVTKKVFVNMHDFQTSGTLIFELHTFWTVIENIDKYNISFLGSENRKQFWVWWKTNKGHAKNLWNVELHHGFFYKTILDIVTWQLCRTVLSQK